MEDTGGEAISIKQLHAKLFLVDRSEAIIGSAELTGSGVEGKLETRVWSNNPALISDI